jgi:hypothetical protein
LRGATGGLVGGFASAAKRDYKIVLAVIEQLHEHSIEARTRSLEVHALSDPARLAAAAQRYAALCVGCHLAPGATKSDIRPGLYDSRDLRGAFERALTFANRRIWGKSCRF